MSSLLLMVAAALAAILVACPPLVSRLLAAADAASRSIAERGSESVIPTPVMAAAASVALGLLAFGLAVRPLVVALSGVVALSAAAVIPRVLRRRDARRLAAQLGSAAEAIGSSCEAGLSFPSAVASAASELDDPIAREMRALRAALELGARTEDVLEDFSERVGTPDARLFAAVVAVQRRSGGDIGRSLRLLGDRMARRRRLERELRSATAQARSTAAIVAVLPAIAAAAAELAAPGVVSGLLAAPAGITVVGVSAALQLAGLALVRMISRVPA